MSFLLFLSVPVILLLILVKPKWGTFLIWPILFTYPHSFWYSHGFLPLNIGVDDLFCLFLFVVVLLRRNLMGSVPIRFGFAFWVITGFAIVSVISHLSGFSEVSGPMRTTVIKDLLKNAVFWSLFYAVLHCIDNPRDLRVQFSMFSLAALIGAALIILQKFFPYRFEIFAIPQAALRVTGDPESRVAGAFMNPNAAACIMTCSSLLVLTSIRLYKSILVKSIFYAFTFILLVSLLFTQSRAGLIALFGAIFLMGIFGKNRGQVWILIGIILIVGFSFTEIRQATSERFGEVYNPETGDVGMNVEGRFEIWKKYFEVATFKDYLLGQGPYVASVMADAAESHSLYVSLFTIYGLGGVLWAFFSLVQYVYRSLQLRRCWNLFLSTVGDGCLWALVAWGIYGIASDAVSSNYSRYMLFFLVVLIDRAFLFYRQEQWMLQQQMDYDDQPEVQQ